MLAPVPSMELESEIIPNGNPDSDKKQHALVVNRQIAKTLGLKCRRRYSPAPTRSWN